MSKQATKNREPATEAGGATTGAPGGARPERDPVSPFGHEILALFLGPLAGVRFPDVDGEILDRCADDAYAAQIEVEAAERALEEARARTRDATAVFLASATRALAYARVFAAGQPVLEAALAAPGLAAPGPAVSSADQARANPARLERETRRRGRPKKDLTTRDLLPMGSASADDLAMLPSAGRDELESTIAAE